ncbi:MAG: type III pantothenate kinase [Acidobacteriota bacterium]
MLFAIDVGNTQSLLGVFGDQKLKAHWRLTTDRARTVDEFGILARTLFNLEGIEASSVRSMVVSCVVPPLEGVLERLGKEYFGVNPLFVTPALVDDLTILYKPTTDVGPDRIVNAVAAREGYGLPVVVVDFGTATTLDVVDAEGAYRGGAIAPGVGISADALYQRAARLPRVDIARPRRVIGDNTVESIQSGIFFGYVDLVDGLICRIVDELGTRPQVIATGGWAADMASQCHGITHVDPLLTLEGLRIIARRYGPAE